MFWAVSTCKKTTFGSYIWWLLHNHSEYENTLIKTKKNMLHKVYKRRSKCIHKPTSILGETVVFTLSGDPDESKSREKGSHNTICHLSLGTEGRRHQVAGGNAWVHSWASPGDASISLALRHSQLISMMSTSFTHFFFFPFCASSQ